MRILSLLIPNSKYEIIGKVTLYSFQSILLVQFFLALLLKNRGNCIFSVWYNFAFLSFIHWIPLINLSPNTDLDIFFQQFSQIFNSGILPEICPGSHIIQTTYKKIKIASNGFINNSKDILLPYTLITFLLTLLLIFGKICKSNYIDRVFKSSVWSIFIRLHLLIFLEFITYAFIDIYFFLARISEITVCSIINLSLSGGFIVLGVIWLAVHPIMIKLKLSRCVSGDEVLVQEQILTLIQEFKPVLANSNYQYYSIYLVYRFLFSLSLVFMHESPLVQISMVLVFQMIISNFYLVAYLISVKPFSQKSDLVTVFISELSVFIFVGFIALRSLCLFQEHIQEIFALLSVIVLWVNELVIVLRFVLNVCSEPLITIRVRPASPKNSHPVTGEKKNADKEQTNTDQLSSIQNEQITVYQANHYYINLETDPNNTLNKPEESNNPSPKIQNSHLSPWKTFKKSPKLSLDPKSLASPSSGELLKKSDFFQNNEKFELNDEERIKCRPTKLHGRPPRACFSKISAGSFFEPGDKDGRIFNSERI